jgi:hypothetical protein
MEQTKKETAIRRLHLALKKRFQGQAIKMPWSEMEGFLKAVETIEMNHIHDSYNQGYTDCKAGIPNKTQQDESNTDL